MQEFVRQENNPGALLNIDTSGLEQYKSSKKTMKTLKEHEERIKYLESSLEELSKSLNKLLEVGR